MSHRQMKAADKAVGMIKSRLQVLEGVVSTLLSMAGMEVAVNDGQLMIRPIDKPEPVIDASTSAIELTDKV